MVQDPEIQESHYRSTNPTRRYLHARRWETVSAMVERNALGGTVLEVGVSGDMYARVLHDGFGTVVRLDADRRILDFSRRRDGRSSFVLADVSALPFGDDVFDLVLCTEVIEHVPSARLAAALAGIARTLKPKGALVLSTPQRWSPVERLIRLAHRRPFRALSRLLYDEPVEDWGHVNLLTRGELVRRLSDAGLSVREHGRCGLYIPILAELGGETALWMERWLERRLERGCGGFLLWTQAYVCVKS